MPSHILRCVYSKNRTCFLGVNPSTFNNNILNASDFKVSIVRLEVNNDRHLYFSTVADYTLKPGQFSLNGFFAMKIPIEQDRFYEIVEQTETTECRSVTFSPVSIDDWELLQNNTEMTEDVFLHQIRILSIHMVFPIWISGLCILLRVVQIEPNVDFSVISSSTRVTVIPEYREPAQPSTTISESIPSTLSTESNETSNSVMYFVRSIGRYVCSSLPSTASVFQETKTRSTNVVKTCKLNLIPGRNRRLFRVEIDSNTIKNPTLVRINRSDWLTEGDDDEHGTSWPSQFVGKITVYRSSKEIKSSNSDGVPEHLPKVIFALIQLTENNLCRKKHIRFHRSFASINGIRSTDQCVVINSTRRPRVNCQIELISNQWHEPLLLLQHYFQQWIRENATDEQPILLTHGCSIELDCSRHYLVHLNAADEPINSDSPPYVAMNEETLGQYPLTFDEKKDWNFEEIETFRSTPITEDFLNETNSSTTLNKDIDHLYQILEIQLQLDPKISFADDFLLKNVIVTGRSGSGKKAIVNECCQRLWTKHLIYFKFVDCLTFKGKKLENIVNSLTQITDEMVFRQPSILVLDHFDDLFPNENSMTDANLILATQKLSLTVRELFHRLQEHHRHWIIIPIAKLLTNIHRQFTEETPLFCSQILNIEPLNNNQRSTMIDDLLKQRHQTISDSLLQTIINRTESFVIKDLQTLIDNALLHLWMSFEERSLSPQDFDYAFEEFQPISVKLLDDDTKKSGRSNFHWSDLGGMERIKEELIQTVQWRFEHSNYFSRAPIRLVSGVLLYGPSGCGKTLLAQTLAAECQVNFIQVKGPELLNKYVGSSEQNIRDLFTRARSVTPCLILFDEFEALVPRRGRDSAGVTDRVVNQLLTELDGVESLGDIVVIAATSRPDLIDPALLRPGRLDKHFYIDFPSRSDILSIIKIWTRKVHLADDVKLDDETFLSHCEFYTGADIKALVYNAQLAAFDEYQSKESLVIHQRHFLAAIQQTPYSIPEQMRRVHENFFRHWRKPIAIDQQTVSLA